MQRQLDRLSWRPERWAKEAHLAPTTVTRAMDENYESVSSVPTLHALARAANCPSILDFLEGQTNLDFAFPTLHATLTELLPAAGCNLSEKAVRALADAIGQVIVGLAEQGNGKASDPEMARVLARAARATLRVNL